MKQTQPQAIRPYPMLERMNLPAVMLATEQFERLRNLLAQYSGIYLDATRQRVLELGLAQRLASTGLGLNEYQHHVTIAAGREELQRLAELVLNHETYFFRNKPHMRALHEVVLPELHQRRPTGVPLRLWSAGCATGEEAYSLAIMALETLGPGAQRPFEVWATDLSDAALEQARVGFYRGRALSTVSPELLARYFTPHGNGYLVNERVRSRVRFERVNLSEPLPVAAQAIDALFCQNVLIYFQPETTRQVLERFYHCLADDGGLFLGFSETLWNVFARFQSREIADAYVYYKDTYFSTTKRVISVVPEQARPEPRPERPRMQSRVTWSAVKALESHTPCIQSDVVTDELLLRSQALCAQGEFDHALDLLQHVTLRSASATAALLLAARIHADRGEIDLAVAEVQRAIARDSLLDEAYILLGVLYSRQGQWQAAAQQFERARYLNPTAPVVSFQLAQAYRALGRSEQALREYRTTMRKLEAHPPDGLLDGVAVSWLRTTCWQQIAQLEQRA